MKRTRKLDPDLKVLTEAVAVYLAAIDILMTQPENAKRGRIIAHLSNKLELQNDQIRLSMGADFGDEFKGATKKAGQRVLKAIEGTL